MDCAGLEAVAAELALGVADGEERATALAHLAGCPRCRELVGDLGRVADDLLLLAPELEPPLGFEGRVRDRIVSAGASARRPARRGPLVWVAAAVVVVIAGAAGLVAGRSSLARREVATVSVVRSDEGTCRVVAFPGHPAELVVRLDEHADGSGDYRVDAYPAAGGAPVALGTIHMHNGRGVLDATVPPGVGRVSGVVVTDSNGTRRYRNTFAPV